jgi:hypothetical protein
LTASSGVANCVSSALLRCRNPAYWGLKFPPPATGKSAHRTQDQTAARSVLLGVWSTPFTFSNVLKVRPLSFQPMAWFTPEWFALDWA